MDIFFLAEKKKRARNSNRINRTSETTLRDKERGERGKNLKEGEEIRTWSIVWKGWLRSREARQGAFSLAATKRRRFLPAIISFPFLSFLPPPPSFSYSTLLPSLLPPSVEIPRGAHSIIRYLCRTRHKSNPWQEKRPSLVHDGPRNAHPFLLLLSCHSSSPLPPFPNRCFAETRVRKSCHHSPIFPSRNAIPIPTRFPVKYLLSAWPD